MFDSILLEWDLGKKIPIIEEKMIRYGFKNKVPEMKRRISGYRQIILNEFS